jgi:excinuclease ABC subunit A
MAKDRIVVKGAREHNLKNISLEIPRDELVVFTGLSGSGKSSLAFDTLYADGQRRYVESLSSYARQFLGQMEKPDVDSIEGLSPAISIDQKSTSNNPRSTVGTVTEIYDYLRLLYANIGTAHCPVCGAEISSQTIDQMVDRVLELEAGCRIQILAPVVRGRKGEHQQEFNNARRLGYSRVRVDGEIRDLTEVIALEKNKKHTIDIVVDRLIVDNSIRSRLAGSLETALSLSGSIIAVDVVGGQEILFSQNLACPEHDISVEELVPRMFSFNNPYGACPTCTGLGTYLKVDPDLVVPNKNLTIRQGAIRASGWYYSDGGIAQMYYDGLASHYGFSLDQPYKDLSQNAKDILMFGNKGEKITVKRETGSMQGAYKTDFEGIVNNLERRFRETSSSWMREEISGWMSSVTCPDCRGRRLKPISLAVTVGGINISSFTEMSVDDELKFIDGLRLSKRSQMIAGQVLKEIRERLGFLKSVGLDYLALARSAATLSGGESQRIRLATQIGSSLMGVLYILDEPSIGLHQRDNGRLIATLKRLRDLGNTVIVVEHDDETIMSADFVVDIGPGAGVHGGEIVYAGDVKGLLECSDSITGDYLSCRKTIPIPKSRRKGSGRSITIKGARHNNLKSVDVTIPLATFTAVTGVSGSGKSSLINDVLYKKLAGMLNGARMKAGEHDEITGAEALDKVIAIDQSPIGRTPRSNPATYTGVFTDIRALYASTNEANMRGYAAGRFSFNVKGGRCEACQGDGIIKIEMHFLPDVYVPCEICKGQRYNRETLEIRYKGKNIHDVLEMTVEEALEFFANIPRIKRRIQTIFDVGLGYIKLGQSATTLSGGEAQRVKLATELSKRATGRTLYVLDEPTTGLHTADVHRLIDVLQTLVDAGNTIVVIEHNLNVIKVADYVIDLGPEGGDKGGRVIGLGTPERLAKNKKSYTARYLAQVLSLT